MKVTFAPRGVLQIDDARIIFRNFRGEGGKFNKEGDRNFALAIAGGVLDDGKEVREVDAVEMAEALQNHVNRDGAGWNVKIKLPTDDGGDAMVHLPVKVKFNDWGPAIYLHSGDNHVRLTETTVQCLDSIDIAHCDMDLRPYDDVINGKPFRSAYLQELHVVQEVSRFRNRYAQEEYPEENGPDEEVPFGY